VLVFTTLTKQALPLLRYWTGDITYLTSEPCVCGRTLVRMGPIVGRTDDMLIVRGVNVYPSQVEDIVRAHPEVTEFVIEHRRVREMDEVSLLVEVTGEGPTDRLEADLRQALGVRLGCRVVPTGTLPRSELKSKRIVRVEE
jgi:phenylacetate-coenzyme A ligase PaaK-like adenylate-forming protein